MLNPDLLRNAAILIEEQFSCGRYNGLDFSLRPFAIKPGQGNIVISAPHSVNHIRNNPSTIDGNTFRSTPFGEPYPEQPGQTCGHAHGSDRPNRPNGHQLFQRL